MKAKLIGIDAMNQSNLDYALREIGGEMFGSIGGNVACAVSMAAAKLAAQLDNMELYEYINSKFMKPDGIKKSIPRPLGNLIGGGVHSSGRMTIQEILISPKDAGSFMEAAHVNATVHRERGEQIAKKLGSTSGVNVEGAWITPYADMENLELAAQVKSEVEKRHGIRIDLGIDFAASEYFDGGRYTYSDMVLDRKGQIDFVLSLINKFGLAVAEDPMDEDDFDGFAEILRHAGNGCEVVGDDLYTSNADRVVTGIERKSTNCVLVKVNQIGTLSETMEVVRTAHMSGMRTIVSHRSRETTDSYIAHLAVAFGSDFIKTGIVGGERVSKLNELDRIEAIENSA